MRPSLTRPEWSLLLGCVALLLAALLGPHVAQPAHVHDFADQRTLGAITCAADVLSNLPFALAGISGLFLLRRARFALDARSAPAPACSSPGCWRRRSDLPGTTWQRTISASPSTGVR